LPLNQRLWSRGLTPLPTRKRCAAIVGPLDVYQVSVTPPIVSVVATMTPLQGILPLSCAVLVTPTQGVMECYDL
jgi:hypothetical protein